MKLRDRWLFRELAAALEQIRRDALRSNRRACLQVRKWYSCWLAIHPKRIESVGYLVLLTAALWEVLLRQANDRVSELVFNEIHVQLKLVIDALESGEPRHYLQTYRRLFIDDTEIISRLNEIKRGNSVNFYSAIRMALFAFGSFSVVFAKWREGRAR